MRKILLLDWDGPVSNHRVMHMPHKIDPVAVHLLNEAFDNGWEVVLTSTIRKHYGIVEEAYAHFAQMGINISFFADDTPFWRTDPGFTSKRHLEFLQWYSDAPLDYDEIGHAVFCAIDDEDYPLVVTQNIPVYQESVDGYNGIQYRELSEMRKFIAKTDDELTAFFNLEY